MISLDTLATLTSGKELSFDVTYVDNSVNWLEIFKNSSEHFSNSDVNQFFKYLQDIGSIKSKSFYVENLYVMKYKNDIYREPFSFIYCTDGKMYFPTLSLDFGMGEKGSLPISKDVVKFDVGLIGKDLTNNESIMSLKYFALKFATRKYFLNSFIPKYFFD